MSRKFSTQYFENGSNRKTRRRNNLRPRSTGMELLEPRVVLAANPLIAEFQASNDSTIADSDGDFEDWIEIRNPNAESFNLDGWYLTDDPDDLTKWRFPSVTVGGSDQILVFASDKDRTDAASELHTNFKLSAGGDYLAIVEPNGTTVSQEYAPEFPGQETDQSYGLAVGRDTTAFVNFGDPAEFLVPTGPTDGWNNTGFDSAAFTDVTTPIGYEQLPAGFTIDESFDSPLGPEWTVDIPAGGTGTAMTGLGVLAITVPDNDAILDDEGNRGTAPLVHRSLPEGTTNKFEFSAIVQGDATDAGKFGLTVVDGATGLPAVSFIYTTSGTDEFRMIDAAGDEVFGDRESRKDAYHMRMVFDGSQQSWTGSFRENDAEAWTEVGTVIEGAQIPTIAEPRIGFMADGDTGNFEASVESMQFIAEDGTPVYGPTIATDVEAAMSGVNASSFVRYPFTVDGDPARLTEMSLAVQTDDGFAAFLNGEEIATFNVPADFTWNSAASGSGSSTRVTRVNLDVSEHASKLNAGDNVLAIQSLNVAADDNDTYLNVTLTASEILSDTPQVFVTPTPGAANELPAAQMPVIMTESGAFFGSKVVELGFELPSALDIRYTLDGSEPDESSAIYSSPITLTESAMVQARAFDPGAIKSVEPSNIANATFFILDESIRDVSSNLPIMVLDTLGGSLPGTGSTTLRGSTVLVIDVDRTTGRATILDGDVDYLGRGGVRARGSSTGGAAKPNMAFETWGTEGTTLDDDDDVGLLGLAPESDWVLHAPFEFDRSLIHNQFAFDLSNQVGQWAPHFKHVELYFNTGGGKVNDSDYYGIYVLVEKIKQGKDRVDIQDTTPDITATPEENPDGPNISGGYIWKADRADPDGGGFSVGAAGQLNWVHPKGPRTRGDDSGKATAEQEDWVQAYFDEFHATLDNPDINDPNGYTKFVDLESWTETHLINVLTMNVDAIRLSGYLYKDVNDKIHYGPIWDFDRAMESNDGRDDDPLEWRGQGADMGTDFFGVNVRSLSDGIGPRWFKPLFEDPGYWQYYIDTWQDLRQTTFSDENILATIDRLTGELLESAPRNFEKWRTVRPRSTSGYANNTLDGTYDGEINNLKTWLLERVNFMDSNFASPVVLEAGGVTQSDMAAGVNVSANEGIKLSSRPLVVNNDTQLISGVNGATDIKFFVPQSNDLGNTWTALNFDDAAWTDAKMGVGKGATDRNGFADHITTIIDPTEVNADATNVFMRIPFTVDSLDGIEQLILKMKYDDGFVASLNGEIIVEKNLRDTPPTWDSRASSQRNDATLFEDFNISEHVDKLRVGENVLAIRGINSSAANSDLLFQAELVTRFLTFEPSPDGDIYYTTDGSDPRGPDGMPSASATKLDKGASLSFPSNTQITARVLDTADRGPESRIVLSDWGGPRTVNYIVEQPNLVISEVNYNPVGATTAELAIDPLWKDGDFEFIEVTNAGTTTADLTGVRLGDGAKFEFANGAVTSLAPGASTVVVSDPAAFAARYGDGISIAGRFAGDLSNNGEDLDLFGGTGEVIFSVRYDVSDPWPASADGPGATLELADLNVTSDLTNKYYSWRGSREFNGTPGSTGAGPVGVVINEVLSRPGTRDLDSIELHNTTNAAIDISGWYLSDSDNNLLKYQIPAGTVIGADRYVVFDESQFNVGESAFGLGTNGDSVWLVQADNGGNITAFVDNVSFGGAAVGESFGRIPNGTGRLSPLTNRTFGSDNGSARVGPVVISEINYNPAAPTAAALALYPALDAGDLEFVEVHNPTGGTVNLTDWRLRGGVDFSFDDGTLLPAGGSVVVVAFNVDNPENSVRLAAFRTNYGIGDNVTILGGYSGQLNNADDEVRLLQPSTDGDNIVRFQADEVLYDDLAPWPAGADGLGGSLQRRDADLLGNSASSWVSNPPTPGTANFGGGVFGDFSGNGVLDAADIDQLSAAVRTGNGDLAFDVNGDGAVNESDRTTWVKDIFGTSFGDSTLDGIFNSSDLVAVFRAAEYEDATPNNSTWAEGDWNGDGDFTTLDLVRAFQDAGYVAAAAPNAATGNVGGALIGSQADDSMETIPTATAQNAVVFDRIESRKAALDPGSMDEVFAAHEDDWQNDDDDDDDVINEITGDDDVFVI